jgi:hypothetical protein
MKPIPIPASKKEPMKMIRIKNATKQGYAEIREGGGTGFELSR